MDKKKFEWLLLFEGNMLFEILLLYLIDLFVCIIVEDF